jgi:hypothetical protein
MEQYVERLVDLIDPEANRMHNFSMEQARELLLRGNGEAARKSRVLLPW